MGGKGKIRYVFTSSHTGQGFVTFIPGLLEKIKRVYVLKGAPGSGKSTFIRCMGDSLAEQGYDVEFWMSAEDPMNPEGVYIIQMETAIVNGNLPLTIDPKYPGITGSIINLSAYLDELRINKYGAEIMELVDRVEMQGLQAVSLLEQAALIKGEMLQASDEGFNENKLHKLISRLENEILKEQPGEKHYFASSITPEGIINYVDEISSRCKIRYLLKGGGFAAEEVISEIASKAREAGYLVEYYHCGLNPLRIIMVIITHLQLAIIEANDMEVSTRPGDRLLDLADCRNESGQPLQEPDHSGAHRQYENLLLKAQAELEIAHKAMKNLKRLYSAAMNFETVEEKRQEILNIMTSAGASQETYRMGIFPILRLSTKSTRCQTDDGSEDQSMKKNRD